MAAATNGLDVEMSEKDAEKIASEYLTEWEKLRPYLGLSRAQEKEIQNSNPRNYGAQKSEFMGVWKEKKGKDATYTAFIQAAEEAGKKKLADSMRAMKRQGRVAKISEALLHRSHEF